MKLFLASSLDKTFPLLLQKFSKSPKESKVIFVANAADPFDDKWWIELDKLSKMAEVTLHTITKIESGATPDPRIETLRKIAAALGVGVDDLLKK